MNLSLSDLDRLEEIAASVESGRFTSALYGTLLPGVFPALVAMARRAPRWTPVEERLPDDPRPQGDRASVLMGWNGVVKSGHAQEPRDAPPHPACEGLAQIARRPAPAAGPIPDSELLS